MGTDLPAWACALLLEPGGLPQTQDLGVDVVEVDLVGLAGCRRLCTPASLGAVGARLPDRSRRGVVFLGGGDVHHLALALLEGHQEPFTLVLLDHHADAGPSSLGEEVLSCGCWVEHALRLPRVQEVLLVGADASTLEGVRPWVRSRVRHLPLARLRAAGVTTALASALPARTAVHLSVDKDVLSPVHAVTTWTQGDMSLDELATGVAWLARSCTVLGVDVCGDEPPVPGDPRSGDAVALGRVSNRRLLEALGLVRPGTARG
jgi:arginase family enzyme